MTASDAQDMQACIVMLREGSRSFSLASQLLPAEVKRSVVPLYAFCRSADDAIDLSGGDAKQVQLLQERVQAIFQGTALDYPEDRAFARVVQEHNLPQAPLDALIDGFTWDAESKRYESLSQLLDYAARVAGSVGVLMALIMGERRAAPLARALDLGVAMQLTNVCRDVGEDAAMGRLYLPRQKLQDAGVDPDAFLRSPEYSDSMGQVVEELLAHADELYARAHQGIRELPPAMRRSIRAAALIYQEIGLRLRANGYNSVDHRSVVPRARQLGLLVKSIVPAAKNETRLNAPVLAECDFLLQAAVQDAQPDSADWSAATRHAKGQ